MKFLRGSFLSVYDGDGPGDDEACPGVGLDTPHGTVRG